MAAEGGRPLTVVLADDSEVFRLGMARALRANAEFELVAEADGGLSALAMVLEHRPDVAFLDLRMPGLDGLEVVERLRAAKPPLATKLLLLSAYVDDAVVARAEQVGCDLYLSKAATRREILGAAARLARE